MEYIYAALLLHKLGKEVTEKTVKAVVAATGTDVDDTKIKSLVVSLKDVDIGKELTNVNSISAPVGNSVPAVEEKKKEAPKKEEKKEAAAEGLSSLFG